MPIATLLKAEPKWGRSGSNLMCLEPIQHTLKYLILLSELPSQTFFQPEVCFLERRQLVNSECNVNVL